MIEKHPYEQGLRRIGFTYDPFEALEASQDRHLARHITLGNDAYSIAWESESAAVYAPAGGGKTALRIYTTNYCWQGAGYNNPHPITWLLTPSSSLRNPPSVYPQLVRRATHSLFTATLLHPDSFLDLSIASQRRVATFFRSYLTYPLSHYEGQISDGEGGFRSLVSRLDGATLGVTLPTASKTLSLLHRLQTLGDRQLPKVADRTVFNDLVGLVIDELKGRAFYLLVDGLDGTPETSSSPDYTVTWLEPLLEAVAQAAPRTIYFKGFFPSEMDDALAPLIATYIPLARSINIQWTTPLLVEMLRRRVWVATDNLTSSLGALGAPDLGDIELEIVRQVAPPLPREVILLTREVLSAYFERSRDVEAPLDQLDIHEGVKRYLSSNHVPA